MHEVRYTGCRDHGQERRVPRRTDRVLALICGVLVAGAPVAGPVAPTRSGATPAPALALLDVVHGLEARALVITGTVRNRGAVAVRGLAVDVTGTTPSGAPAFFGSDGVPWPLEPGTTVRFAVRLPLGDRVVRAYAVEVWPVGGVRQVLASTRREVDPVLYLPVLPAMVRVEGDVRGDALEVRSRTGDLPVTHVLVDATVSVPGRPTHSLERFVLHVPANGRAALPLGTRGAFLVALRVVDVRIQRTWLD
jgi:hypothetical protein